MSHISPSRCDLASDASPPAPVTQREFEPSPPEAGHNGGPPMAATPEPAPLMYRYAEFRRRWRLGKHACAEAIKGGELEAIWVGCRIYITHDAALKFIASRKRVAPEQMLQPEPLIEVPQLKRGRGRPRKIAPTIGGQP